MKNKLTDFGTMLSSIRYKENVKDIDISTEDIMNLKPVTFNYKSDDNKTKEFGLIAEEVNKIIPELIFNDDGLPTSIKYANLIPILLNEIQKLNKRILVLEDTHKLIR